MNVPTLSIKSVTGVDVELQIAGPGSRSYAFVIDWHIRLLFAAFWFVAAGFSLGSLSLSGNGIALGKFSWAVAGPSLAIYFLYHPVIELIMRGRTPGKRIAGIRLVSRQGEIPSAGAILLRNLFRVLDALPSLYVLGLACAVFTRHHVRIGDIAAGTLLIIDATESERSLEVLNAAYSGNAGTLGPRSFELAHELLERWDTLDDAARGQIARTLLVKIDQSAPAETLATSTNAALRERLRGVLAPGAAA
jgi:uncharacterized RDD family membrane protein YckC